MDWRNAEGAGTLRGLFAKLFAKFSRRPTTASQPVEPAIPAPSPLLRNCRLLFGREREDHVCEIIDTCKDRWIVYHQCDELHVVPGLPLAVAVDTYLTATMMLDRVNYKAQV